MVMSGPECARQPANLINGVAGVAVGNAGSALTQGG
jgi:hypothetical protein